MSTSIRVPEPCDLRFDARVLLCNELLTRGQDSRGQQHEEYSHSQIFGPLTLLMVFDAGGFQIEEPENKLRSYANFTFRTGSSRTRFPVAAKIAFAIAGAIGGTPGSPAPPGGSVDCTMCTRVSRGAERIRITG